MSWFIDECNHKSEVINHREGEIVCFDCGLVLDRNYEYDNEFEKKTNIYDKNNISGEHLNYIKELIERLNVPSYICNFIYKNIQDEKNININELLITNIFKYL